MNSGNVYGPEHNLYPSTFFGSKGMDIGYIFDKFNGVIPAGQLENIQLVGDTKYTGYKPHTPLTSEEAELLIKNINQITIEATHGPINNNMPYDKLVACINELSMGKSTEDHTLISSWGQMCESGLAEPVYSMEKLESILKSKSLNVSNYNAPGPLGDENSLLLAPELYAYSIRATGIGHPGEYSENYNGGLHDNMTVQVTKSEGRIEWLAPRKLQHYSPGTVVDKIGNLSGRRIEIPIVNYLDNPRWIISTVAPAGNLGKELPKGSPTYDFVPYTAHSNEFADLADGSKPVKHPDAVQGDWLIGTINESKVREILNLQPTDKAPVIGYITLYSTSWSSHHDSEPKYLPWFDQNLQSSAFDFDAIGISGAAAILREFNRLGVKHIIVDERDTLGGGTVLWGSLQRLIGDERISCFNSIKRIESLDTNGIDYVIDDQNIFEKQIISGIIKPKISHPTLCKPSDWVKAGVPADCVWNGVYTTEKTGIPGQSNIIWYTNQTTISATQLAYCHWKGTSINKEIFDGNLGNQTQFIGYGVYNRPFSTAGNYNSYINWYGKNRAGSEPIQVPLLPALDRWEISRIGYTDSNGVVKSLDQEFNYLHRPHIKWDMNANVFFQDIGFTIGNPGVNVITDGEPWLNTRYPTVIFGNPLTYRDTVLEHSIKMLGDPNINTHIYQDDGYGYVYKK